MNFYLASSGIIPVLAVTVLIEIHMHPLAQRVPPAWLAWLLAKFDSDAYERGGLWQVPVLGLGVCYSEFVCLRTLETGRVSAGGATPVWVALAVLAGLALAWAWIITLPEVTDAPADQQEHRL